MDGIRAGHIPRAQSPRRSQSHRTPANAQNKHKRHRARRMPREPKYTQEHQQRRLRIHSRLIRNQRLYPDFLAPRANRPKAHTRIRSDHRRRRSNGYSHAPAGSHPYAYGHAVPDFHAYAHAHAHIQSPRMARSAHRANRQNRRRQRVSGLGRYAEYDLLSSPNVLAERREKYTQRDIAPHSVSVPHHVHRLIRAHRRAHQRRDILLPSQKRKQAARTTRSAALTIRAGRHRRPSG